MTRPTLASRDPRLEGLQILVVGLGKSGLAAARLALERGARVIAADRRSIAQLGDSHRVAQALGIDVRTGEHAPSLAADCDLIVVSPGVPLDQPLFDEARRSEVPIWGEVELAARFLRGRMIGITGSNGKSTVTSMTGAILRAAGLPGGTGGNLDTPLAEMLRLDEPGAVHAVELSSFQLESIECLKADVAVVVNLSPDHLDRYPSFESYARAKARLLETQDPSGHAVLNADDPESRRFDSAVSGRLLHFSTSRETRPGAFVRNGRLVLATESGEDTLLRADELPVPGEHNRANALAAALACRLLGCAPPAIAAALRNYRALPHRLELVGSAGDVKFYDDSKATNVEATLCALTSFPEGSVQLILGGRDKGADWSAMLPVVRRHSRRVLLIGEAAEAIDRVVAGAVETVSCGTVPAAVREAFAGARPGDVVLLSPACASFDQYANFEERGDDFRRSVERSIGEGRGRA